MKILVTGVTGFLGGQLIQYLNNKYSKEQLVGTGRNIKKAKHLQDLGYNIILGDLSNASFVSENFRNFDCIIHCAAKSSVWGTYESFYDANILSTENLIKVCGPNTQLIYISTANIYFNYSNRINIKESDELPEALSNYYAETKYLAEQIILNATQQFSRTILRPRAIIGIGDSVVFPRLLKAYDEGKLRMVGNGKNRIDFTSINNLCHAIDLCIGKREPSNNQIYNITNGDTVNLWTVIKEVLSAFGKTKRIISVPYILAYYAAKIQELLNAKKGVEPSITCYGVAVLKYSVSLNIDKIKKELAYEPLESSEQTLREFISWYKTK